MERRRLGWHVAWTLLAAACLPFGPTGGHAKLSKDYLVTELCRRHFLQQLNYNIDGATLRSTNEPNLNCKLTFQTESILQRFMVRFDYLHLDCNDHLYIHDGAHIIQGKYKADLSCRNTKESVGTLFMRSNHLTIEYSTDSWGTSKNGFRLVITAYKDHLVVDCDEFLCDDHCISSDLKCDGVVHCVNGEDESSAAGCIDTGLATLFGVDRTVVLGAAAGGGVVLLALVVSVAVCACRRRRARHANNGAVNNTYQMASVNYTGCNGTRLGNEKQPFSENWLHPATWTGSPLSARCSPSRSKRRGQTVTPPARRMSGSCERRSHRRGAWPAVPSSHAHTVSRIGSGAAGLAGAWLTWSGLRTVWIV